MDSDALVEVAAREMCKAKRLDPDKLDSDNVPRWHFERPFARAVIAAIKPAALEEAIQAVETIRPSNDPSDWTEWAHDRNEAADRAVAAIRALKEPA